MHIELNRLISFEEYLEAVKYTAQRPQRRVMYFGLFVLTVLGWFLREYVLVSVSLLCFVTVIILLHLVFRYYTLPLLYKRDYGPAAHSIIEISEDGISVEGIGFESKFHWSQFANFEITLNLIIIRLPNNTAIFIPKRCLTEADLDTLVDFLRCQFGHPVK